MNGRNAAKTVVLFQIQSFAVVIRCQISCFLLSLLFCNLIGIKRSEQDPVFKTKAVIYGWLNFQTY